MKLHIIGSGSKGNCYLLEGETSALVIECGMPFMKVKQSMNFLFGKIAGCIISHEHGDHFDYLKEFAQAGIDCYMSKGTYQASDFNHHRLKIMKPKERIDIGEFKVFPFDIEHDAKEPFGFIISHPECGNILFLTDTQFCKYKFPKLNQIIIEANYCEDILLERSMRSGMGFLRDRIIESHMSLRQCRETLIANDLSAVHNIVIIHLSDSNSHSEIFHMEIERSTGKNVTIADNGKIIDFNLTPF